MGIQFVACRHTGTGQVTQIPETALSYFPAFERIDKPQPNDTPPAPAEATETPTPPASDDDNPPARPSKPATRAAKNKE